MKTMRGYAEAFKMEKKINDLLILFPMKTEEQIRQWKLFVRTLSSSLNALEEHVDRKQKEFINDKETAI